MAKKINFNLFKRKIIINMTNKSFYSLIAFGVLILLCAGFFVVNAYGTNNPAVFGHSAGEIGPGTFPQGTYVFDGNSKIGIGTDNPGAQLDILDTAHNARYMAGSAGGCSGWITGNADLSSFGGVYRCSDTDGIVLSHTKAIHFYDNSGYVMHIKDGNVAIGKSSPVAGSKLDVNGYIMGEGFSTRNVKAYIYEAGSKGVIKADETTPGRICGGGGCYGIAWTGMSRCTAPGGYNMLNFGSSCPDGWKKVGSTNILLGS